MIIKQKVMAIGAHADDIEAIAGGTLAKALAQGYDIVYVMSTNNFSGGWSRLKPDGTIESRSPPYDEIMPQRKLEADAAARALGTTAIHLDYPQRHYTDKNGKQVKLRYGCPLPEGVPENVPTILDAYEDAASVKRMVDMILEHNPACIITLGMATTNIEHLATALLVVKSFWQAVEKGFRGALIQGREDYSAYGEINMRWDTFIDISDYLDKKMALLGMHSCQMPTAATDPDHGHRLRPLKWGVACGCKAAEVFTWVRRYDRPNLDASDKYYSPLIEELIHNSR
jgi:LmbE family N-acetylglucosaminyl deacetylase